LNAGAASQPGYPGWATRAGRDRGGDNRAARAGYNGYIFAGNYRDDIGYKVIQCGINILAILGACGTLGNNLIPIKSIYKLNCCH
jgi:hypothetical protein